MAPKRARFGSKRPFWGPLRSSEGRGGQIWSQLPPIGPPELDSWSTHTLTWYWTPSGPQGALKGLFGPNPKFPRPNFFGNSFCFNYRLVECPERRSGMPGSFSTVIAHMEPPSSRKQAKRVRLGPERPLLGPWRSSEGPGEADLIPTTPDWPAWVGFMVTTHFDLVSGPFWA